MHPSFPAIVVLGRHWLPVQLPRSIPIAEPCLRRFVCVAVATHFERNRRGGPGGPELLQLCSLATKVWNWQCLCGSLTQKPYTPFPDPESMCATDCVAHSATAKHCARAPPNRKETRPEAGLTQPIAPQLAITMDPSTPKRPHLNTQLRNQRTGPRKKPNPTHPKSNPRSSPSIALSLASSILPSTVLGACEVLNRGSVRQQRPQMSVNREAVRGGSPSPTV